MITEQKFIQGLLPANYYTDIKHNGIYCYCNNDKSITINEWEKMLHTLKIKYGTRFTKFNFIDTVTQAKLTERKQFTIFLKP